MLITSFKIRQACVHNLLHVYFVSLFVTKLVESSCKSYLTRRKLTILILYDFVKSYLFSACI